MTRQGMSRRAAVAFGIVALARSAAVADPPATTPAPAPTTTTPAATATAQRALKPEESILLALQTNPVTAPYRFAVQVLGRQFVLSGRVGSRAVHDVAIRTVIAMGYPVRDDLVIDTREADRAAAVAGRFGGMGPVGFPYLYPPPLFGRLDDPFLGFEPPILGFAPDWAALSARPPAKIAPIDVTGTAPATVQLSLDDQGVAYLRGAVASQAEKETVEASVAGVRGVRGVVNELQVVGNRAAPSDTPPPPPTPAFLPVDPPQRPAPASAPAAAPVPRPDLSDARPAIAAGGDPLARKVSEALARRPDLAGLGVKVSGREGVVTLSGKVPSAYEAMLAFRAAEQTPGVREVVDRLEFTIPDDDDRNPLRTKARPEDLEPYLTAQVRRQLGDLAHVDRVRLRGDTVEVAGTVGDAADVARAEATLRSIPLLRGFRIEPAFHAE